MTHHPQQGWPAPQTSGKPGGMLDLGKGGLGLGMVATIVWGVFMAGQTWGSWQSNMSKLSEQVAELKTDMKEMKAVLVRLDQRWAVEVRK
jgi:hypothetical protein